jgi:osmotically inducible protein OsmC
MARHATAIWQGTLKEGSGSMSVESGAFDVPFSFTTRFGDGVVGTNPEELIGAANAGCFTMGLGNRLSTNGLTVNKITTVAAVSLERVDGQMAITSIHLDCKADVPGLDAAALQEHAQVVADTCIVTRALAAVKVTVTATPA